MASRIELLSELVDPVAISSQRLRAAIEGSQTGLLARADAGSIRWSRQAICGEVLACIGDVLAIPLGQVWRCAGSPSIAASRRVIFRPAIEFLSGDDVEFALTILVRATLQTQPGSPWRIGLSLALVADGAAGSQDQTFHELTKEVVATDHAGRGPTVAACPVSP